MSQLMKKRFPSITSIDVESDGNTSFLRAARNGQLEKVLEHLKSNIDINTSNANGLNALHLASKDGHVEIVEELLKRGAVVDAATKKGNTALHIASLAGQEEVVKLLVQHGASVNVQSQNGFTPLYMAAQENHDNVVKFLLANGANQSLSTEDGFTPLAVAMQQGHDKVVTVLLENDTRGKIRLPALHIAAKKDDVKAAKLLLENEHNPDVTSKSGFTPLHIASHYGNQQIANLLIQKGADVNYAAKHNITPLHVAAKWGKTNMVALLLEHGATIESKTRDGLTPLHCAARSGHEQVVDMLLERGAPISSKTKNGLAPLHMAAQGDHVDAARILLYHRAPVDEVTVDYLTALHVAAHCGHVRVAKLLLDRQADANARALNGFTPLHIACKKNRLKVVELLLKHGASIGATTESGLTPLHVASFMGCMNIVIYLLQHDANPDVPTVRGETPLHLAARANQTDIIRILLRNGAQVDARAREQQTPLHIASRLGNVDIVMLLLQHGAKVDNTTKDMYTSLHIAAKEGQDEVVAVLLDNGASLDATTKKGFTPLHLAAKYGHLKVAKLLLQKEAPVDAQGKNGVTPLHVASHYDHQNVALLLLDKGASPHATAKNGHTPLHIAARKNQMDIANTLLEYGAQSNAESKAGFTPLHLSAQEGHAEMSALLLEHKADANYEAKNGLTPLHLCAQEDRVPVAEILVKNGANVNAATNGGYTPLHIASHYGQTNMVKFLLQNGANVKSTTSLDYTPLHQAAQQGHANIVNILLENDADPNAITTNGQTPLNIAQKLGYITVIETLKVVTTTTTITTTTTTTIEEKYRVQAPELMHETFMSDSEEEGGEDTVLGDQTYRYLTADEMKSLGDDSLPIDVTRDERIDSNRMVSSADSNQLPPQHIEDSISPEHVTQNYVEYIKKYTPDNVDIGRHPISIGFLVSFLVDARGGAMRGCRHSGVRVIVPPRCAPSPTRITCRYVRPQRTPHPPPLMEGEALASRVLELGPVGAKFLGPVIIEVPHFAALRGKEREIVILRSDNGESWKEHTVEATEEVLNEVLHDSFEAEDLNQLEDVSSGRITRIVTQDFPQYFAVVSRVRQEVHAIGPEGGMVSSTVVPQVQAVFPEGALTKKIKVGLQAQPIDPELTAKLLGHGVAVSPVVTVEPRRRKFHKAITLSMPAPRAHSQGMINQYSGSAPTLRLLCSITGGTTRAQWEDVTGSTPLTFVNDCVSFTTTVSARFWLMDCRNIGDATKMATELYKEAIHVPFMAKFVVFAKRVDPLEARLRVFCMTDDKEDKTLEHQEHFTEVAKSRDVEVLEGKLQYVEFAGNLVPITKSGEQLSFSFRAFRENRLPFSVRVKDQHAEAVSRCLFMKEPKVPKGEPPQQPICILNIVLPDDIVTDTISLTDTDSLKKYTFLSENFDYYRPDPRIADMSNLLGEDWVPLANQLGLTTSEINVIKSEYPDSVAKQAQSMLRMWLSQSGNKAQTNTIENALRRIGREDIIPQCLNVDHGGQTITRIKQEEIGKYRLKKDVDSIDKEIVVREHIVDTKVIADKPEGKKKLETYDKYSAEEKAVEKSDEEEETFDKPVAERREKIEKRLSAERTIPASSQRREIVQEITSIKQQSIVEDKIAEVQQKATADQKPIAPDQKTPPDQVATAPEQKSTPEETKTTLTKTITTATPDIRTVSETVEIKTTLPSDSKVSGAVDGPVATRVQEVKTTIITETRTTLPDEISHRTADGAELLEGVTLSLEKGKPQMARLIGDEDPKSPKFSKTPPPSPADFLIREQAATVQEWDASRKPAEPESKTLEKDAAQQGKTTSTTHYLASNEEIPLIENSTEFISPKPIYDQINALIQSESRAEPFHIHTERHYNVKPSDDEKYDRSQTDSIKEEKKKKKSILGTIKTFVGKSLDHSDSEPEKSPKKERKHKRDKARKKTADDELPPEVPSRPPRKPKLPTPTEDRKFADIPYFETSPSDVPPFYKSHEKISPEKDTTVKSEIIESKSVTVLDETESSVTKDIKDKAKEVVTSVITDGEKFVKQLQKSPKSKKQTVVIVEEKISKTFAPAAVEEEEFTIIIDPTKKGSPKKTKETFTLNIDESIDRKEKEILEKSPILPDEKLIKPTAHIETPVRPPRIKDHVYEDIEEPPIATEISSFATQFSDDVNIKMVTTNLIQNEINFTGWADDKHNTFNKSKFLSKEVKEKITDSQKMKRKHGKLLGLFGKSPKEADESDDESKNEVVEKHDKETSKEQDIKAETLTPQKTKKPKIKEREEETNEFQKSPKKGKGKDKEDKKFLGLFKKGKKEEPDIKPAFSDSVIKDMIDSTAFLKEEVDKYHDVRPIVGITETKGKIDDSSADGTKPFMDTGKKEADLSDQTRVAVQKSTSFLNNEIEGYHDVRPIIKQSLGKSKSTADDENVKEPREEAKGFFGLFKKKPSEEKEIKPKPETVNETPAMPESVIRDMQDTNKFLEDEINIYHDVRVVTKEMATAEMPSEKSESEKSVDGKGLFGFFKKKLSEDREAEPKVKEFKPAREEGNKKHTVEEIVIVKEHSALEDQAVLPQKDPTKESKQDKHIDEKIIKDQNQMLSEKSVQQMHETDNFLNNEIKYYHDVHTVKKVLIVKEKPLTDDQKGDSKGLFGLFKKKRTAEKDMPSKGDEKVTIPDKTGQIQHEQPIQKEVLSVSDTKLSAHEKPSDDTGKKIVLSDEVLRDIKNTDNFLQDEILKYHDVRPITKEKISSKVEEKGKGNTLFGTLKQREVEEKATEIKTQKDAYPIIKEVITITETTEKLQKDDVKPKKEIIAHEPQDTSDTLMLSEKVVAEMNASKSFLEDEIDRYHDVRPVTQKEDVLTPKPIKAKEQKGESKGLFGLFKKKRTEEKDATPKVDVKPSTPETIKKEMHGHIQLSGKEEPDKYDDEPTTEMVPSVSDTKLLDRKKTSDDTDKKIVLSDKVLQDMKNTDTFLLDEIVKYHDVRPIITQGQISEDDEGKEEVKGLLIQRSGKGVKSGLEIQRDAHPIIKEVVTIEETIEKQHKDDVKSKKDVIVHEPEQKGDVPVLSEQVIAEINTSRSFLEDEVNKYHDVRPVVQKDNVSKSTPTKVKPQKDEGKDIFGIFKKKKSEEKEIEPKTEKLKVKQDISETAKKNMHESQSFLTEEINRYHDVRPIIKKPVMLDKVPEKSSEGEKGFFGLFKKKKTDTKEIKSDIEKFAEKPGLSEIVIRNMQESDSFLKDEIDKYHDVRPTIKELATTERSSSKKETKDGKREAAGLLKEKTAEQGTKVLITNIAEAQDVCLSVKDVATTERSLPAKDSEMEATGLLKEKPSEQETKLIVTKIAEMPVLSEIVIQNMKESDLFLKNEVDQYHDVRPIIRLITKEQVTPEKDKKSEGKGFMGLFKKKKTGERETKPKIEKVAEKPVLSETVFNDMKENDLFLKEEVDRYHDVRPDITKEQDILRKETKAEGKGFLTLTSKKPDEIEIKQKTEVLEKPAFSDITAKNMLESDRFLKQEINGYHDVRPIIKDLATAEIEKLKTQEDDKKGFLGLFTKKLTHDEAIQKKEKVTEIPTLSEIVIKNMQETDSFLTEEVNKYHDVRPIVKQPATLAKETPFTQKEQKEDGKGLFGLFKKNKSEEKETEPKIGKIDKVDQEQAVGKVKQISLLSENVTKNMDDTDLFIKNEVDRYHDVRPIIKPLAIKAEQAPSEEEQKGDGKGFLGLFKKRRSEEKEIKPKTEPTLEKIVLSEIVVKDMEDTESFLKEEVNRYHDVRPIITDILTTEDKSTEKEQKEGGKGFLGLFKKKRHDDKDLAEKTGKIKEKLVLSEHVIRDMQDSSSFLTGEISRYHDVRPIIKETVLVSTERKSPAKEQKVEEKGLLGLFRKKKSEERETVPKSKKVVDKPVLSENVLKDMQESSSFLKEEIDRYHDVRPIVQEPAAIQKDKPLIEKEQKDDGKGFLGLFKKKKTDEKEIESKLVKTKDKPVLSENTIKDMHESDSFLKKEVDEYHDVRPIVKQVATIEKEKVTHEKEQKDDGKGFFGLFKKKKSEEKEITAKTGKTPEKTKLSEDAVIAMNESNTFLKEEIDKYHDVRPIYKDMSKEKKEEKEDTKVLVAKKETGHEQPDLELEKVVDKPLMSENTIKDMNACDSFLVEEVNKYHDVRPIISGKTTLTRKEKKSPEKKQKEDGKRFLGLFKKRRSEEKEIESLVVKKSDKPVLSEKVLADMQTSNTFLEEEVSKYHDVRPIVKEPVVVAQEKESVEKADAKGFLGLFKKKRSEDKDSKPTIESTKEKRVLSQTQIEPLVEKKTDKPVLSEKVLVDMQTSNTFLEEEVSKYHDVRPIVKEPVVVAQEKESVEKTDAKGFLGLFMKKRSEDKDSEPTIESTKEMRVLSQTQIEPLVEKKADKPVLSEKVLADMQTTNTFLEEEVSKYHDVRPIVKEPVVVAQEKETVEKADAKGFIGLFKKKRSEDKDSEPTVDATKEKRVLSQTQIEPLVEKRSDKPVLSEKVLAYMQTSKTFLEDEVSKYHDVRPFIKKPLAVAEEKESVEKADAKGFLGLFKKIRSDDKDSDPNMETPKDKPVLSQAVVENMHASDSFINVEIDKYHDVRPIIRETSASRERVTIDKEKKDDGKGFLGLFKKKKSEKKETESKSEKDQPVASEAAVKGMEQSGSFLDDEINRYHDVRPEETSEKLLPQKEKKRDEKGLFGLFKKKSSEDREVKIKPDTADKPILSERVIADMQESNSFLTEEISRYHDVRPLVKEVAKIEIIKKEVKDNGEVSLGLSKKSPTEIEKAISTTVLSESIVRDMQGSELFLEDEVDKYHDVRPTAAVAMEEKDVAKKESDEGGFFGLFKKKRSGEKDFETKLEKVIDKPVLSEHVLTNMNETKTFLDNEIDVYHDVQPIIKKTQIATTDTPKTEALKTSILQKETLPPETQSEVNMEAKNIHETTNFLNTELERYEDAKLISKSEPSLVEKGTKPIEISLSETTLLDMITTTNFIREEVSKYHDVRPIIKSEPRKKSEEKESKSGKLFGLFGKKKSEDREGSSEPEKKGEKVEKEKKQKEKKDKEKKKSKSKEKEMQKLYTKQLNVATKQQEVVTDSKDFLSGEIERYHDKEKVDKSDISTQESEQQSKEKGSGFFGLFSKKNKPQEKVDESISEKKEEKEYSVTTKSPQEMAEMLLTENMPNSAEFINTEIINYDTENIKPALTQDSVTMIPDDELVSSKQQEMKERTVVYTEEIMPTRIVRKEITIFKDTIQLEPNVLSDLSNLEKEIEMRIENLRENEELFGGLTKKDGQETGQFVKQEVKETIVKEETTENVQTPKTGVIGKTPSQDKESSVERHISSQQIITSETKSKDHKKSGSPFKLFGRKQLSDDDTQNVSERSDPAPKPIPLSKEAIKKMQDTHSFLTTEITNYEDGKPELITDLDEDSEKSKLSGLFGLFSKKEKSASPKIPKRKLKKHKSAKSSEEAQKLQAERVDIKLTGTYVEFKDDIDETINTYEEYISHKDFTDTPAKLLEDTKREIKHKKVAFADIENDIVQDSGKIVGDLEELKQCATEKLKCTTQEEVEEKSEDIDQFLKDVEGTIERARHVTKQIESDGKESLSELKDEITIMCEKTKDNLVGVEVPTKVDTDKKQSKSKGDKPKKSFLSKLGAKIGVKSEDITTKGDEMVATIEGKHLTDGQRQDIRTEKYTILKDIDGIETEEQHTFKSMADTSLEEQPLKEDASSFVNEIMQSFDDTMEHVKDGSAEVDQFKSSIDVKTMADTTAAETEKTRKESPTTQEFLEREKKSGEKLEGYAITVQNVDDAVAKLPLREIQPIQESVTAAGEKTSEQVTHVKEDIQLQVEKLSALPDTFKADREDIQQTVNIQGDILQRDIKVSERSSKKGTSFLGKLGKKISGHSEEIKDKSLDETTKLSDKGQKKGQGFFGKLGEKITGKSEEIKSDTEQMKHTFEPLASDIATKSELSKESVQATIAGPTLEVTEKGSQEPIYENVTVQGLAGTEQGIKKITLDFIEAESFNLDDAKITRASSDYGGKIRDVMDEPRRKISEANIDLSNLPTNIDEFAAKAQKTSSYVTSPTLPRRTVSQRLTKEERPEVVEITGSENDDIDDDWYIVTEPVDPSSVKKEFYDKIKEVQNRKALFHIESEDDENLDILRKTHEIDRQDSSKSNVLETLTELKIDALLTDLTKSLSESQDVKPIEAEIKKEELRLEEHVKESQTEVDLIEKKLRDLDKALDSLEQTELKIEISEDKDESKSERKLRRIERKFERMASEVLEKDAKGSKSAEVEEKRNIEYRRIVSQLSTEEISDFQKEYSHLWDEHTFSKSDEWDSKTPDSQEDVQELPQGEIVYMGPVNLNKDNLINKAGIEVDVIPIMRSPCPSPKPKKKSRRAQSEMGFYKDKHITEDDRGSLPDLMSTPTKGSLVSTIMRLNADSFLSNESLVSSVKSSEQRMSRSVGSAESLPKGAIMNAVVSWLQKSSPFSSTDNIDHQSVTTSIPDTMDVSMSIFDEEDLLEHFDEKSKSEQIIPDILISEDDVIPSDSSGGKIKTENIQDADIGEEASASVVREPPPPVRAEGEEGSEKEETGSERKVADQHQLSDEMKALLKELERESKQ